jgi:hypothetical protein
VHLIDARTRTFDPIGWDKPPDPKVGNRLFFALAEQERVRAVVGGGETKRFRNGVVKATRGGKIGDDDAGVWGMNEPLVLRFRMGARTSSSAARQKPRLSSETTSIRAGWALQFSRWS